MTLSEKEKLLKSTENSMVMLSETLNEMKKTIKILREDIIEENKHPLKWNLVNTHAYRKSENENIVIEISDIELYVKIRNICGDLLEYTTKGMVDHLSKFIYIMIRQDTLWTIAKPVFKSDKFKIVGTNGKELKYGDVRWNTIKYNLNMLSNNVWILWNMVNYYSSKNMWNYKNSAYYRNNKEKLPWIKQKDVVAKLVTK